MHHRDFSRQIDGKRVAAAIGRAEERSSAQLRVFVSHEPVHNALEAAHHQFHLLGMEKTRDRNAVLLFLAPESQKFAIYGDVAIDRLCGVAFWETIRDEIVPKLKSGDFTAAIVHAVERAGDKLAEHFPPRARRVNELPDEIAHD